jgi:hypothetical protein
MLIVFLVKPPNVTKIIKAQNYFFMHISSCACINQLSELPITECEEISLLYGKSAFIVASSLFCILIPLSASRFRI